MSEDQIKAIFGTDAKIYKITSVDTKDPNHPTVTGTTATRTDPDTEDPDTEKQVIGTEANVPYILELQDVKEKDGVSYDGELDTESSKYDDYSNATTIGD